MICRAPLFGLRLKVHLPTVVGVDQDRRPQFFESPGPAGLGVIDFPELFQFFIKLDNLASGTAERNTVGLHRSVMILFASGQRLGRKR